ncbi:MAG: hypothetical protein OXN16_00795 [Gammaproteobacteria bacterium]|nr:hypothetical protein [Gammaproteobacteria bacterium]MDE0279608.1 hypothetical protein [Gammaproteobacteria bacterium]MXX16870.1 hypothetical protein [Gammaproteobacteria bacterium]MXY65655.1 hypothetical protein [Gammaproteobacteria bacterium]MYG67449.1 hypothetical protein [Gammaproteobacteria bacterium]
MGTHAGSQLVVEASVADFFQGLVNEAVENQHLEASAESVCYLINLLSTFASSEALFEASPDGPTIQPLALLYGEAMEAPSIEKRNHALKRLGDVALFISGIFSDSLNRKVVDVDYYITMGGLAYGCLSSTSRQLARWHAFSEVFGELGTKFARFVDVLNEVGDQTGLRNDHDIMRLYEIWQRTGSRRARGQLQRLGIIPVTGSAVGLKH